MNSIRHYINIIESAEDRIVYHAGTYTGGEYDPSMVGEPGDIRPLGKGIYAAKTKNHAERYLKYVSGSTIKKFKIADDAQIYPWGGAAWNSLSTAEQEKWRVKSNEVQEAFEEAGFVKKWLDGTYKPWTESVGNRPTEEMRKLLVSLGVDGAFSILPSDMTEFVFYNTAALELITETE